MALERRLFAGFLLALLALALASGWQWRGGAPVSASLLDILPAGEHDALVEQARQNMESALQRELVVLVQHPQAPARLADWAAQLQASGLFQQVDYRLHVDLQQLGRQLLDGRNYMVPLEIRRQLADAPQDYFVQRAESLFDPLASFSLVSLEQDWLGLTTQIRQALQQQTKVQADNSGLLQITDTAGQTWYLLRLQTVQGGFDGAVAQQVAALLSALRHQIKQEGGQLLATGGLLFSAAAQDQAQGEIQWLGSLSLAGALALILLMFRRLHSLLAALPALFGLWLGVTVCIALFGQIHAITLVLGVSLIGVTIDFPMHYMSKAWSGQPWDSGCILRATLPGLSLGMLCNALGYLALAFTPFPALTQVAVFSVAGLLGAWFCTLCALPWLLRGEHSLRPRQYPLRWMQLLLDRHRCLTGKLAGHWWLLLAAVFVVIGLARLQVQNDLRQWVVLEPELLQQAQQIGELTGQQPASQFFLVHGRGQQQTLERLQALLVQLDSLVQRGQLGGYRSVLDVLAGLQGEPDLATALAGINETDLQPLLELGITAEDIRKEIAMLQARPSPMVDQALQMPLAEAWRMLWLEADEGVNVALVPLQGRFAIQRMAGLATADNGVVWVDRPGQLNSLFAQTQYLALWAKVLASLAIFGMLSFFLGWRGASRTLGISLLAALLAAAALGWLGIELTLFSIFGFLLVTAIGVDYAIMMYEGVGGAATSLLGAALAAATTWLSFGLLLLSATPAVSSFGLAVSLGLVFCFLLAPWAARPDQ